MKITDFRPIVRDTLAYMGEPFNSPAAEQLLCMTAVHESGGFKYDKQVNGPALGYMQIEPTTYTDIAVRYLHEQRPELAWILNGLVIPHRSALYVPSAAPQLQWNAPLQIAIARLKYWMVPEPLPSITDNGAMASYWRRVYNTRSDISLEAAFVANWEEMGDD